MPNSRLVTPSITTPQTERELSFLGELYRARVSGADTAGGFAVLDTEGRRGHGSPLHIHRNASETFLVLEGTLRVVVEDHARELSAASGAGRHRGATAARRRGPRRPRWPVDGRPGP